MPRPRRILIASRLFAPEVSAGAFRLRALAQGFLRRGHEVRVVTTTPPPTAPATPVDEAGLTIARMPVLRDRGGNVRGYLQYLSFDIPLFFRMLFARFDQAVAEAPPTTGLVVSVVSRVRRKPYAYYAADIWTDGVIAMGAPAVVVRIMRAVEGHVMRKAACVLSISDEVTERITGFGVDPARIATVGNGVDTTMFTPDGSAKPSSPPYLVYTGTMSEWQGAERFVEAMPMVLERHPDAVLRFFGQGASEPTIRAAAERLAPGRVELGGVVPPSEAAEWIRGAAAALVSIVPGIGYDFARPTKTYAAAACGTPVIFAGTGSGAALVRDHGLGRAVDYRAEDIAEAMILALDDAASGETASRRRARASWVEEHASLRAVGGRAADAVLAAGVR
ncbi:glycosyltransferase family 4 protein [Agromyces soli]|uniref:Glycosyltransferase family 4 protein n=1 Tax=Agromyces soli TaxID=659012 RepID=A0ABY4ASB0_9MICO|nr:glycosyltransferase family 4 protein [Agromyces soli]UOE26038.1 glycosyltransferase family 4 protein [Agromyces soli]